jgi:hypothetical protein
MRVFPDRLLLADAGTVNGSRIFMLECPFRYFSSFGVITVPGGFITDGASIPRCFWNILAPFGEYFEAAIIHDYLYSPHNRRFTRAQADAIFKEAMFNVGIGWLKRETIYRAVRAFGWTAFKGNPPP